MALSYFPNLVLELPLGNHIRIGFELLVFAYNDFRVSKPS
jgi:hypothetical protein